MIKAEKIKYYSQLNSFPWEMVAKSACGITSAAMAMSYFDSTISPMDVLKKASEIHEVPRVQSNYWLALSDNGKDFYVPIGQEVNDRFMNFVNDNKLKFVEMGNSDQYKPIYSIAKGYDHRGSERLFAAFDIKAKMVGDKKTPLGLEEIRSILCRGNLFLISATRKNNPWIDIFGGGESNHIMLVTDLVKKDGRDCIYILDPFSDKKLVHIEPIDALTLFDFNGYGTEVFVE